MDELTAEMKEKLSRALGEAVVGIWSNLPNFTRARKRAGLARGERGQVERMETQMATATPRTPRATGAASAEAPL